MFENVEQLVNYANLIGSESERVKFVMNYFLSTVNYDYAWLMVRGFIGIDIEKVVWTDENKNLLKINNPFKRGVINFNDNGVILKLDDSYSSSYKIIEGKSELLDKITYLYNNSGKNENDFYKNFAEFLKAEFSKHLDNDEVIEKNVNAIIKNSKKDFYSGQVVDNKYYLCKDIGKSLIYSMMYRNRYYPVVVENGLLKNGVCGDYSKYLISLLSKIGIDAIEICGTSELNHSWIGAIIDGELKSIDLTRAIYIRDGYKGICKDQKSSDWLIADFGDTFKMQSTRTIREIGEDEQGNSIPLPYIINGENYDANYLESIVRERLEKQNNNSKGLRV